MTLWLPLLAIWLGIVLCVLGLGASAKHADKQDKDAREQWARESNAAMVRYEERQRLGL